MQGINWKICNELDAENAEQKGKKRKKGETNMQMQKHGETLENFI